MLIRLACDAALHHGDPDSSAVWAPVHAWRALGQLRAEASIEPLLALLKTLEEDEAVDLELPVVFGMIGPAAIPHIAEFLSDRSNPASPVATAISGLNEIVVRHPECRGECIGILVRTLELHADTDRSISGSAVSALIDLHAVEAIDTIRDAFRRNSVDISIAGDEEDVEIELGLRDRRATPAPRYAILPAGWSPPCGSSPARHPCVAATREGWPQRPVPVRQRQEIQKMLPAIVEHSAGPQGAPIDDDKIDQSSEGLGRTLRRVDGADRPVLRRTSGP